jgi:hypothetical protein
VKKYWAAAVAAACCVAVDSDAASASVLVAASDNRVVVASWDQRQRIAAPGHDRSAHDAGVPVDDAGGLDSPSVALPGALTDAVSATVFRLGSDRHDSGADSSRTIAAIRLPEPATWAMMFVGLSMIGLATRRRRNFDVP